MNTENQNVQVIIPTKTTPDYSAQKMSSKLEERKGNSVKPLSLRPNRSVKKNLSLKPLGLRSR